MMLSLRGRLLIGVVMLVVVGVIVSDIVTYAAMRNSLISPIEKQLGAPSTMSTGRTVLSHPDCRGGGPGVSTNFPTGSVTERVDQDGTVLQSCTLGPLGTAGADAGLQLPNPLPTAGVDQSSPPFSIQGAGGSHYLATAWTEDFFGGDSVVFAIPLDEVNKTLNNRLGLRPLEKMGAAAGEIAAGDYSKRVEPATSKTEIGRLGLALNAMLAQIEAAFAQRTASERRLRRFIADASHELRTPLTSIRGYSEMLRRGAEESPQDADLARRRIEEESVRMSALVDDMLLIARLDQGRPLESRPVDLQVIARDAAADARVVAPQREITLDAPDTVIVAGDDTRLRQVVGNLVRNALVHTPPTTPVEIAVTTVNGTAHLSVADHGSGLGVDDRDRIFEPFYRFDTRRTSDIYGVGLAIR